jgi:hypothetical protein
LANWVTVVPSVLNSVVPSALPNNNFWVAMGFSVVHQRLADLPDGEIGGSLSSWHRNGN